MATTEKELNIPTSICGESPAMNRFVQQVHNIITEIAVSGVGSLTRFRLEAPLEPGNFAAATMLKFNGADYADNGGGTVHDDEPGGFWSGGVNAEGWATGRDGQSGHYSVVSMPTAMAFGVHRGVVTFPITKGGAAGVVNRYVPGTSDLSAITDAVESDLVSVPVGKAVVYFGSGGVFWVLAVERVLAEIQLDMTESADSIDALKVMAQIEVMGAEFWEEKIVIASCP